MFLTNAPVDMPWRPFEDDDHRRLIEPCGIKAAKQPWDLGHPPQPHDRAVRGPVICPWLLFAWATAYRLQREPGARGGEPVGWQRWRRQLLEQTRDRVMVLAEGSYGILQLAEYSLFVGGKRKDWPPGLGTRHDGLAKYTLTAQARTLCWNLRRLV